jgi:hypothetical protein
MSRTLEGAAAQPKISFTNWILGGPLVTVPPRQRKPGERLPSGGADKGLKPKYNFIDGSKLNERRYYQNRRVSRDKVTDTKKDAEKGNTEKKREAEAPKKAVPKDEIAKKEEVDPRPFVLITHYRQILIIASSRTSKHSNHQDGQKPKTRRSLP